ncbi:Chemotaxis protein [Desulfonema limicola]|uniref:Chemotaxis protein n=2 Tax=Desulfonema limicola TaxID=45656 RepID=A0A975BA99_9BACT|nr:Chemotaxis protein [Desulfonema limicola]
MLYINNLFCEHYMNITLLIIDQDNPFRNNLIGRLHHENYKILLAVRQEDIKQILDKEDIDVVLLNLDKTNREGLMILKQIKTESPLTEIIIINSSKHIALSIEGMKLGAFDDFFLPFDVESLIQRIKDAFLHKLSKK